MTLLYPGKSVPGLAQNPVCRAAGGCEHVVPLRMFVDGVGYQGRNSFTLWTLGSILNEMNKPRLSRPCDHRICATADVVEDIQKMLWSRNMS